MAWAPDGTATAIDLYYDPVVDEHVARGPGGLIAPGWYLAPQRREVADAAFRLGAMMTGALGDAPMPAPPPAFALPLVQLAGELADDSMKARIWAAADQSLEPTWDRDRGEFTFGFGLGEEHPRGQWNARAMAGWVCTTGAWSDVFNRPNLGKFEQPTVVDVDFPRVAMSVARWDGAALHLAASPQNAAARGTRTAVHLVNLGAGSWVLSGPGGSTVPIPPDGRVELIVDDLPYRAHPIR